ncbi:MAG: glycosyltransferase family 4 protein [Candidatus Moraniibacteriota bacterium]
MKILHIVAGELTGGAARGAYWLHLGLKELGVDSRILTNSAITFGDKNIISTNSNRKLRFKNIIRKNIDFAFQFLYRNRKKIIFSTGFVGFDFTKSKEFKEADIIHLHWINGGFVDIKHLAKIKKPVVWTMRDMWPMTGGCHVAEALQCENYKNSCGNCRQLNSKNNLDLSYWILKRKHKYLPKKMKLVGISNWLSEKAKESQLFKNFDIRTISNNINTKEFFPIDKQSARKILGISTDKKILLVGSTSVKDIWKGFDKFLEAIEKLDRDKYFLCFFGELDKNEIKNIEFEHRSFGFLYDIISLRLLYSVADIFIAPSIMDAFGKTLAESMACGTPVVCFDATGPRDIVTHKVDGYKAKPFEGKDLVEGIEWISNNENYEELCKNARKKVVENFDINIIAGKYKKLYEEILSADK